MTLKKEFKIEQKLRNLLELTDSLTISISEHQKIIDSSVRSMKEKFVADGTKEMGLYAKYRDSVQMNQLMTIELGTTFSTLVELWSMVKESDEEVNLSEQEIKRLNKNLESNPRNFGIVDGKVVLLNKQLEAAIKNITEKQEAERPELIEKFFENVKNFTFPDEQGN